MYRYIHMQLFISALAHIFIEKGVKRLQIPFVHLKLLTSVYEFGWHRELPDCQIPNLSLPLQAGVFLKNTWFLTHWSSNFSNNPSAPSLLLTFKLTDAAPVSVSWGGVLTVFGVILVTSKNVLYERFLLTLQTLSFIDYNIKPLQLHSIEGYICGVYCNIFWCFCWIFLHFLQKRVKSLESKLVTEHKFLLFFFRFGHSR